MTKVYLIYETTCEDYDLSIGFVATEDSAIKKVNELRERATRCGVCLQKSKFNFKAIESLDKTSSQL